MADKIRAGYSVECEMYFPERSGTDRDVMENFRINFSWTSAAAPSSVGSGSPKSVSISGWCENGERA